MALSDILKLFKNADGYNAVVGKKEMDDNLVALAEAIDAVPVEIDTEANAVVLRNLNDPNFNAGGVNDITNSYYATVFGTDNKINANFSSLVGLGSLVRQPFSFQIGTGHQTLNTGAYKNIHAMTIKTDDDTAKDSIAVELFAQGLHYVKIVGMAAKEDLSAKWIFERILIVSVDSDGAVTIESDTNNDVVKDVDAWAFDVTAQSDETRPTINIAVTGEEDTTIRWGYTVENHGLTPYLGRDDSSGN